GTPVKRSRSLRFPPSPQRGGGRVRGDSELASVDGDCDVGIPDDVNPIADLDLVEHLWIDDTASVFPFVRALEGYRRGVLVYLGDGRRDDPVPRDRASGLSPFSGSRAFGRVSLVDRWLARLLHLHDDLVVVRRLHLVSDLEFAEPLRALGHVEPNE